MEYLLPPILVELQIVTSEIYDNDIIADCDIEHISFTTRVLLVIVWISFFIAIICRLVLVCRF
jgi:hypothetical protein